MGRFSLVDGKDSASNRGFDDMSGGQANLLHLDVRGMHCDKCAATVERLIKGLPQVQRVSVDYPAARAIVTHSGELDLAALQAAVAEDGYSLSHRA